MLKMSSQPKEAWLPPFMDFHTGAWNESQPKKVTTAMAPSIRQPIL